MNNLFIKSLLALALATQLTSCKTQMAISNGAYSDISLVRESKDYSIKRLGDVNTEGKAFLGIPVDKSSNKKQSMIVRFNGVNMNATGGFLPTLSMIGLTITTGYFLNELAGYRKETVKGYSYKVTTDKYKLGLGASGLVVPLVISSILAIPISGAINNQIWYSTAYKRAAYDANNILLKDNPDIDVFLNPKYQIEKRNGIWTQKAIFKVKVMGATIKAD